MNDEQMCVVLNSVIEVLLDGREFYAAAANKVDSASLREALRRMTDIQENIITELSDHIEARGGTPSVKGTMGGALAELMAKAKANLAGDDTASLISALEDFDNRILEEMRGAALTNLPGRERRMLLKHVSQISKSLPAIQKLQQASL